MHVGLVLVGGEDLHVAAAAVDLLLVFHRELDHQGFTLVAEGVEATGQGVKAGVLTGLQTWREKTTYSILFCINH